MAWNRFPLRRGFATGALRCRFPLTLLCSSRPAGWPRKRATPPRSPPWHAFPMRTSSSPAMVRTVLCCSGPPCAWALPDVCIWSETLTGPRLPPCWPQPISTFSPPSGKPSVWPGSRPAWLAFPSSPPICRCCARFLPPAAIAAPSISIRQAMPARLPPPSPPCSPVISRPNVAHPRPPPLSIDTAPPR
jgi:hypothetical protein